MLGIIPNEGDAKPTVPRSCGTCSLDSTLLSGCLWEVLFSPFKVVFGVKLLSFKSAQFYMNCYLPSWRAYLMTFFWVTWVAQLVKHPTLGFSSSHNLTVHEFEPCMGLCAMTVQSLLGLLSSSLSTPFPLMHILSLSQNKLKN